jgi:hypothetical protein
MLAMDVNDNAGSLAPRVVLGFIASMLAPTGEGACHRSSKYRSCQSTSGCGELSFWP